MHPAELSEPVGLERLQERFLLEEPAELAEPGVLVQPAELAVLVELAEPEPLPDEELRDEPGLVAFALVYQPLYDGEVVRFGRETGKKESFTLVVRWKETEQESSVFILFMPSWLRNQRAYAGLVLTRHYNKLSYHRISLGAL